MQEEWKWQSIMQNLALWQQEFSSSRGIPFWLFASTKQSLHQLKKKKKKKSGDLKRKLAMRDRTWDLSAGPSSDAQALPPDVPYWICKISKQVLSKVQTEMKICMHHKIGRVKSNQVNRWGLCQNRWAGVHMLKVSHLAKIIKHTTGAHEAAVLCFQRSALL